MGEMGENQFEDFDFENLFISQEKPDTAVHPAYSVVSTPCSYGQCSEEQADDDMEPCWFPLDQLELPSKQFTFEAVQSTELIGEERSSGHQVYFDSESQQILVNGQSLHDVYFEDDCIMPKKLSKVNCFLGQEARQLDCQNNTCVEQLSNESSIQLTKIHQVFDNDQQIVSTQSHSENNMLLAPCSATPSPQSTASAGKKIIVEECLKKLLRAFRTSLKRQFNDFSQKKHYHWVDTSLRKQTLIFFTNLNDEEVSAELYKANEEAFFKLVHHLWTQEKNKQSKKTCESDDMKHMAITGVYKEIFGQRPNKKNLNLFFSHQVVKVLWQGNNWKQSKEYKNWKNYLLTFPKDQQDKLRKYLSVVERIADISIIH